MRAAVLDSSACIYLLDRPPSDPRHQATRRLVDQQRALGSQLVVSPITLSELLVKPLASGDIESEARVLAFATMVCSVADISVDIARRAAQVRAATGMRLPDAYIVATAFELAATAVIGNENAWKRVADLPYQHIDDEVSGRRGC